MIKARHYYVSIFLISLSLFFGGNVLAQDNTNVSNSNFSEEQMRSAINKLIANQSTNKEQISQANVSAGSTRSTAIAMGAIIIYSITMTIVGLNAYLSLKLMQKWSKKEDNYRRRIG